MSEFADLLASKKLESIHDQQEIILDGKYQENYNAMLDAYNAGLYSGLIGPVGTGKTALCRKFAKTITAPFTG